MVQISFSQPQSNRQSHKIGTRSSEKMVIQNIVSLFIEFKPSLAKAQLFWRSRVVHPLFDLTDVPICPYSGLFCLFERTQWRPSVSRTGFLLQDVSALSITSLRLESLLGLPYTNDFRYPKFQALFEGTTAMKFWVDEEEGVKKGFWRVLVLEDELFHPPPQGWGLALYICCLPAGSWGPLSD